MKNHNRKGFWDGLGMACVILSFCLGIGQCSKMILKNLSLFKSCEKKHLGNPKDLSNICDLDAEDQKLSECFVKVCKE